MTDMMSDSEIAARNPRGTDESEEQWIARCKRVKAELLVQSLGDSDDDKCILCGSAADREGDRLEVYQYSYPNFMACIHESCLKKLQFWHKKNGGGHRHQWR